MDAGGAFAACITGNVASNLIGRLMSAALADILGLSWNFYFFAVLNSAGSSIRMDGPPAWPASALRSPPRRR
jgi:MFS transporter, YNFM family, putative membrane transport protein